MTIQIKREDNGFALYRRLLSGTLDLRNGDALIRAVEGDFVSAAALPQIDSANRRRLGPVLRPHQVAKAVGHAPEDGQLVFRANPIALSANDRPGLAVVGEPADLPHLPFRRAPADPPPEGWVAWARAEGVAAILVGAPAAGPWSLRALPDASVRLEPGHLYRCGITAGKGPPARRLGDIALTEADEKAGVIVLDDEIPWPPWLVALYQRLLPAHAAPDVDVVFPTHNVGGEATLPLSGDSGSRHQRLPGGLSPDDVALALVLSCHGAVEGAPRAPCAAFLTPRGAKRLRAGERLLKAATALDAYAWQPDERPRAVARLVGHQPALDRHPAAWPEAHRRLYLAVSRARHTGLPVAWYSHAVGPWGGVAVLVQLADRLRAYGFSSFVTYHMQTDHDFRPRVSMRKIQTIAAMKQSPAKELGFEDGILVASHWSSGSVVSALKDRFVTTTIVQDREDWFAGLKGTERQLSPDKYRDYLALGRGAAVARWILDSLAQDHGVDPSGYEVIPPGVDLDLFHPPGKPRPESGPVRVLAMWRPQTAKRRGLARLRAVYDALYARHKGRVSLELFGWREEAPSYATHHGRLDAAGVGALMREVDILVEPSEYQGFGLPGLEAMACGCALVSTACQGPREYIVDGENAIMVPHDNLLEGVERLITDRALRLRLQGAAPPSVRRFGWDVVAARWAINLARLWREERPGRLVDLCDQAEEQADRLIKGL